MNPPRRILFVGHEATRTGAPMMLLHLLRWLRDHVPNCERQLLLLKGGPLEVDYAEVARVRTVLDSTLPAGSRLGRIGRFLPRRRRRRSAARRRARRFVRRGTWDLVYVNTIVTMPVFEALQRVSCPVVVHAHEMKYALTTSPSRELLVRADRIIVPSEATRSDVIGFEPSAASKTDLFYECIPTSALARAAPGRGSVSESLGIGPDDHVVCAVGTVDWRKGADLFLHVAARVAAKADRPVHFLWVGDTPSGRNEFGWRLRHDFEKLGLEKHVRFVGSVSDVTPFYRRMDVLALTSREDPCPLVAIEAALHEVPIACFAGSGGAPEVFGEKAGVVAPYADTDAMASQILALLADPERRREMGRCGAEIARLQHDVDVVAPRIWARLEALMGGWRLESREGAR